MRLTLDTLRLYCTECGDCLLWNQSVNSTGYPQASIAGKPGQMVRRYIFTQLLGKTIPDKCVVATRCDQKLCIAPEHLIAMRRGKVQERAYAKGKRMHVAEYMSRLSKAQEQGLAKLNWDSVRYIRSQPANVTNTAIADTLGVSHKAVSRARRGLSWRESYGANSVFSLGTAMQRQAA